MEITAAQVMQLRDKTGAGVMDCKAALAATGCDLEKAVEHLRKSGVLKAAKKADRPTGDGLVMSYVHPGAKLAVLVEINCETDFVARTKEFRTFAHELSLQVAANSPSYVRPEDVPAEVLDAERQKARELALAEGKPEKVMDRIIEGRLEKFYDERCLVRQAYIRDDAKKVGDLLQETMASTGENIVIRRFARWAVGEEIG